MRYIPKIETNPYLSHSFGKKTNRVMQCVSVSADSLGPWREGEDGDGEREKWKICAPQHQLKRERNKMHRNCEREEIINNNNPSSTINVSIDRRRQNFGIDCTQVRTQFGRRHRHRRRYNLMTAQANVAAVNEQLNIFSLPSHFHSVQFSFSNHFVAVRFISKHINRTARWWKEMLFLLSFFSLCHSFIRLDCHCDCLRDDVVIAGTWCW